MVDNLPATRGGAVARKGEALPAGWHALPQHVRDGYLPPSARELVLKGIPVNTLKAYAQAHRPFRAWCEEVGRTYAPVSQQTMLTYLDLWRGRPIHNRCRCRLHRPSPSAMWIWYSAVRFFHSVGEPPLPWECGERLTRAMVGYSVEMVQAGWTAQKAPRAWPGDVTRMVDALDQRSPKWLRDRAIILLGFYTAARASDLGTYRLADVGFTPRGLELTLRWSKTNRRVGRVTELRNVFANDTHPQYCGVEAVHAWMDWLRGQDIRDGALFRPFDRWGHLSRGPADATDYRMDGTSLTGVVRAAALAAHLPRAEEVTMHSLRRGRASQQRELDMDPLDIARAYGWVPGGAITAYLDEADRWSPRAVGSVGQL